MAPRGRTRKPRSSRMDGAIDNMSTYGFPEDLVRRKVKNLLQVYGGEWLFIEADSYSVLLEGLLEEATTDNEEKSRQGENMLVDNPPPDKRDEDPDLLPSVGSSSGVPEQPICLEIINTETQAGATGGMDCSMEVEEHGKGSEDNNVGKNVSEKEIINGPGNTTKGFCGAEVHVGKRAAHSPPSPVISPPSVEANPPRRRRKPCHGWISDGEEDDDDDFIDLPPAPRLISTPAATTKDKGKKRKTRWDVRPEEYV